MALGGLQQFLVFDVPDGLGGEALGHVGEVGEQLAEPDVGRIFTEIVQDSQELAADFPDVDVF